jgi:two-component system phosphate regulon sensor histidine kinase PhoR
MASTMVLKQKRLFWQIFPISAAIVLFTISLVAWYISRSVDSFYIEELGNELENRAYLVRTRVVELLNDDDVEQLRAFVIDSGRASETRLTIVDPEGTVLADTNEDPQSMDNHRMRPEINIAFTGEPGRSIRFSNTLGERLYYTAIPLCTQSPDGACSPGKQVDMVLRLSMRVTSINATLGDINNKILGGAIVAVLVSFCITFALSRNISRPLEEMTASAEQYAQGDFSQRMLMHHKKTASREVATLAGAMDQMAEQLDEKITTIINQRNQLETVFSSMVEAVIAVDLQERIVSINNAALNMFGVDQYSGGVQGRLLQEVIRNVELQEQVQRILKGGESFEDEIILNTQSGTKALHTNVVSLYSGDGQTMGVLMVLNDVTRLRQLEQLRSDFVANVSHELRTPITAIRGYVETLLDGALDERDDAVKFLEIVLRQSEQLSEIIEDLLALSRIEKESKAGEISFTHQNLLPVLEGARDTCRHEGEEKDIRLSLECDPAISLHMNGTLLEQAVVNLLINAITYSEEGAEVSVRAGVTDDNDRRMVKIHVLDNGIGISSEHLPRLFERFYRSDRARSRKEGGTGLGLAIVKHIVQAHGGEVDVKSTLGMGSEFIISLDCA